MKKLYIYIVIATIAILSSCQRDDLYPPDTDNAFLTIKLNALNNIIVSRAVSGPNEEKLIANAHIYIFNSSGEKVFSKHYPDLKANATFTVAETEVLGGKNMTIAVIANIGDDNGVMNVPLGDRIANKSELIAMQVALKDRYIERGTSFLMSGMLEDVSLTNPKNTIAVPLERVDSKIRFNFRTGNNPDSGHPVTFTPTEWRVVSAPKQVLLIKDLSNKDAVKSVDENYFTSTWNNYEPVELSEDGTTTDIITTFAFYALENNISPKKSIPTEGLTDIERYALRDKQIKNKDGTNQAAFEYANDRGTYVEFKGNVAYRLNTSEQVSADVKFIVHLGGDKNDVDNYSNIRNTSYTYNISVLGVNQIRIEVIEGNEIRPGVEGDVVVAEKVIDNLDAYNNVLDIDFNVYSVDNTLTWDVSTPFSKGAATDEIQPKDINWILFRIGKKSSAGFYIDGYNTYSGDQNVYPDALTQSNVGEFLDQYMDDIAANSDKMLNVDQLVMVLKECRRRFDYNNLNGTKLKHLVLGQMIRFTGFVNEFYYEHDPENPSANFDRSLWKRFVNVDKRILNILTEPKVSTDGNSTYTSARYSLRQASIQSIYNINSSETFSGWGGQFFPNTPLSRTNFSSDDTPVNTANDGARNGRRNFASYFADGVLWSKYIDYDKWSLVDKHNYAKYQCLSRNRDINGNGIIDEDELQWYLPSINQLTNLWIGEESISPTSKLYQSDTWDLQKQHIVSSTVIYKSNPEVLWSSEGSSVGRLNNATKTDLRYRCVRNLGLPHSSPINVKPDEIYTFVSPYRDGYLGSYKYHNGYIDLSRLNPKSIRGSFTNIELPDHELRDKSGYNKPYSKFEIHYKTFGSGLTWEQVRQRSQPNGKHLCPPGWRVPNQRELALMYATMVKINNGLGKKYFNPWPLDDHFSRTSFNKIWATDRPGFSATSDVLYMLSGNGGSGGVRCVRDVR